MTTIRWRRESLAVLATLLLGTTVEAEGQTTDFRPVLDAWLTCVECRAGQLDSVRVWAALRPAVVYALRDDLIGGPSPERRHRLTDQLTSTYQGVAQRAAEAHAGGQVYSEAQYVRRYLDKLIQIYQGRAALALGAIGGPAARAILDSALTLPARTFSPGVLSRIRFARDSIRP